MADLLSGIKRIFGLRPKESGSCCSGEVVNLEAVPGTDPGPNAQADCCSGAVPAAAAPPPDDRFEIEMVAEADQGDDAHGRR